MCNLVEYNTPISLFAHFAPSLKQSVANIFRAISTKFYQNRPGFVDNVTKNIWCVFGFAVPIAVHSQNVNANFHKVV